MPLALWVLQACTVRLCRYKMAYSGLHWHHFSWWLVLDGTVAGGN